MRRSATYAIFLFIPLLCSASAAQILTPVGTRSGAAQPRDRVEADLQRRMTDMRALDEKMRPTKGNPQGIPVEIKLTSEARNRVIRLRQVADSDVAAYSKLLKQERTGIFKLFPDLGCTSRKVINVAEECSRQVWLTSSFTFRTNAYGDELYHDIHFKKDRIVSSGFFSQGIFATIGDEPIESVDLTHPALKFLTSFAADTDSKSAADHAQQLQSSIQMDSRTYADNITPKENVTYAIRMIAYRLGNTVKPLSATSTMNELMFLSLAFDKRLDVIVVFRVLGRDENDGLTIVWKELVRIDATKIKFAKNQPLKDFRPSPDQQ